MIIIENMKLNIQQLSDISEKYGDSFYLLDSEVFTSNYKEFLGAFRAIYPNTHIGYSYKTNYTPRLCKIVDNLGGYAEVVSDMEYSLAEKVGVSPDKIIVNGPYKSRNALEKFLLKGSIVNIDSLTEFNIVKDIIKAFPDNDFSIGVRCNFDIQDNNISRFGVDVKGEDFDNIISGIKVIPTLRLAGLHCHFPNRDLNSYKFRVENILKLVDELFETTPDYIDVGGGYFGKMHQSLKDQFNCDVPEFEQYAQIVASAFAKHYEEVENKPKLFLEPGSALVANTMRFVAKIIEIKNIRGRNIAMSTGSKFNIGLLSSTVNMPLTVIGKEALPKAVDSYDISGYTCIESDYLYKGYKGTLNKGDFIVFDNVGSYSIVFKPPFILPNVPIVDLNSQGEYALVKRQEEMEDIFNSFIF
jgi:diaminopimelate decarboxylase